MERPLITAVTHSRDEARVTLLGVPDHPGIAGRIFTALADANVNVDMIIQNEPETEGSAAEQVATGAFANAGQLCTSVERVYLHADVAEAVLAELVRRAESLVVGDPADPRTTLCPLVDERALTTVDAHVQAAVAMGARLLTGGPRPAVGPTAYAPTVLVDCTDDMEVMAQETFGPVAAVAVVGSWDEALARAGAGRYGLAATVLTPDSAHALEAIESLEVGTVKVNAVFGGAPGGSADPRRDSGRGAGYGPDLLREMVVLKAVHWEPAVTSRLRNGWPRAGYGMASGSARPEGGEMTSTARDVMTEGAECVSENDTVTTAAQRMASLDVGALPICGEDDRLKGMLTDRDIVIKVVATGQDPDEVTVGTLAEGGEVVTIGADDPLDEARRTMEEHQVRRLPVIDGHRLVGMVSQGDLAKALTDDETGRLVESISQE